MTTYRLNWIAEDRQSFMPMHEAESHDAALAWIPYAMDELLDWGVPMDELDAGVWEAEELR